jgi:hypothetical protein
MFDFTGYEIVDQRIHDHAVLGALHPGGLAGADHLGPVAQLFKRLHHQPGGGPLPHGRIGAQQGDFKGIHLFDLAGKKVQLVPGRRFADVSEDHAAHACLPGDLFIFGQKIVQAAVHIELQVDGLDHIPAGDFIQPSTVGGNADHQMRSRGACMFGGMHSRFDGVHHRDADDFSVEHVAGIPAGIPGIDNGDNTIPAAEPNQAVGRFAVRGVKRAFAIDNRITIGFHDFLPVKTTT